MMTILSSHVSTSAVVVDRSVMNIQIKQRYVLYHKGAFAFKYLCEIRHLMTFIFGKRAIKVL